MFDAIIIGAGCAGLAAARYLLRNGVSFVVLEARDRIGGRVHSLMDAAPFPIELGAEFIHGRPGEILDLADEFQVPLVKTGGQNLTHRDGKLVPSEDLWEQVGKVFEQMYAEEGKKDRTFREFIDETKIEDDIKALAIRFAEGYNAAYAEKLGVQGLIRSEKASQAVAGDEINYRPIFGYSPLIASFSQELPRESIRLEQIVRSVSWSRLKVVVETVDPAGIQSSFMAKTAIVTLPLGVLQTEHKTPGAVHFEPALKQKVKALAHLEMGKALRVSLLFKRCFWEDIEATDRMGFTSCQDQCFPTWWTQYPLRVPMLVAWASGRYAQRCENETDETIAKRAIESLQGWLPCDADIITNELLGWYTHNWQQDPFSRGAYSYPGVGGVEAAEQLARSLEDTLFFAGEATTTNGHFGTVHGAIGTGERAANEVITALKSRMHEE